MEISLWNNVTYFLWSLLGGFGLALIYDIIRTSRRTSTPSVFRVCMWDIIFIILFGVVVFYIAYDKNGGQLRVQGFAGSVGSFLLYRFIFKDAIVSLFVKIYELVIKLIFLVIRIILFPVRIVYKILEKPVFAAADLGEKGANKLRGRLRVLKERKRMRKKSRKPRKLRKNTE